MSTTAMTIATPGQPQRRHWLARYYGVWLRGQTYRNLLYLVVSLPLWWLYFSAVSFVHSLLFIVDYFFGAPAGAFLIYWATLILMLIASVLIFAAVERYVTRRLLGVEFTPAVRPLPASATVWDRFKAVLTNPVTWKSLVYLLMKLPFVVIVVVQVLLLTALSLALLVTPIVYLGAQVMYDTGWRDNAAARHWIIHNLTFAGLGGGNVTLINGSFDPRLVATAVVLGLVGVLLLPAASHLANGYARAWGWFARHMLGLNVKDVELAEARAVARTERTRAERSDQSRRELILNASHELRTPVASIRAHIESLLMLEGDQLPEHVRSFLNVTEREAERLGLLVDDLLMLARADADAIRLDVRPVDAAAVVEEVYQALDPLARRERQVTLVRSTSADVAPAYADRERLGQVLLNLVRNAITYTPAGGIVSLALSQPDAAHVEIAVRDTGIGIPEEEREHVFERFYRTDASRARHTGGFGLGLSIVRDLVEAMGGTVSAEPVAEGGTTFRVILRAAAARTTPLPAGSDVTEGSR